MMFCSCCECCCRRRNCCCNFRCCHFLRARCVKKDTMPRCRDYFCVFDPCLVFWTTVIAVLEFVNFILLIVCISMTDSVQDFSDSFKNKTCSDENTNLAISKIGSDCTFFLANLDRSIIILLIIVMVLQGLTLAVTWRGMVE